MPLPHIVAMVTSNAAKMIREEATRGALAVGRVADVAVIDLQDGDFKLKDGGGKEFKATKRFRPVFTLKDGAVFEPGSDYLPFWEREGAARGKPSARGRKAAKPVKAKPKRPNARQARTRKAA